MNQTNDRTFLKITNKDIYSKLEDLETQIKTLNSKTSVTKWIATTALTLSLLILGFFIGHIK